MAGAPNQAAQKLANALSKVARYSAILGIGGAAVQSTLYTGACNRDLLRHGRAHLPKPSVWEAAGAAGAPELTFPAPPPASMLCMDSGRRRACGPV